MPIYLVETDTHVDNFACKPAIGIVWFCNEVFNSLRMVLVFHDAGCFRVKGCISPYAPVANEEMVGRKQK